MVKILFHTFSGICITDADSLFQVGIESLLDGGCVVFLECLAEAFQFFHVFFSFPFEPFTDLPNENPLDLPVWNDKFCQFPGLCTALCQIPGRKKILHRLSGVESSS